MNSYKFSVIIPTYNRESFIIDAIDSVLNQTYKNFELIIIDDASTDQTLNRISKFQNFENIQIIKNKINMGVSYCRNIGIKHAKNEYIAFLDSDDIWFNNKLFKQNVFFNLNPLIKICHTQEKWEKNGLHMNQKKIHQKQGGFFFNKSLKRCLVSPSSVVIHKDIFNQFGLFDETLPVCEDYDLWLRLNNMEPFGYIDEPLLLKRGGHDGQLSTSLPVMDKYRILSMMKLLEKEPLKKNNKVATLGVIKKKLSLMNKGAIKHKNDEIIKFCSTIEMRLSKFDIE